MLEYMDTAENLASQITTDGVVRVLARILDTTLPEHPASKSSLVVSISSAPTPCPMRE